MLETILAIGGVFVAYVLRKTDAKIDATSSALAQHKLDAFRDFATKLELRDAEQRYTESNREVQVKLDRIIDHLINTNKK